ncbi:MAG: zinc-binding alcohol dehydrogenase family protein [Pseudomonadota bacterium]
MKQLCIIGSEYAGQNIVRGTEGEFTLEGQTLRFGIVETEAKQFDADAAEMADFVCLRVTAFSCNYRDRSFMLHMRNSRFRKNYFVIGSEFCGEVVAVGQNVTAFNPGDRVLANCAYPDSGAEGVMPGIPTNQSSREMQIVHQTKLLKVPDSMPYSVAGGFSIGGQTAYGMVRRLGLTAGENVLVTGAKSNTSLFAIAALKNYNVNIYALSRSPAHSDELKALGVKELIVNDPSEPGWSSRGELAERVRQLEGFDAMVDPFSDVHLAEIPSVLGMGGRHITCGIVDQHSGVLEKEAIVPRVDPSRLMGSMLAKNITIMGNCLGRTSDLQNAIDDYASGKLRVPTNAYLAYTETGEFFYETFLNRDRFGKTVMEYDKPTVGVATSERMFEPA